MVKLSKAQEELLQKINKKSSNLYYSQSSGAYYFRKSKAKVNPRTVIKLLKSGFIKGYGHPRYDLHYLITTKGENYLGSKARQDIKKVLKFSITCKYLDLYGIDCLHPSHDLVLGSKTPGLLCL